MSERDLHAEPLDGEVEDEETVVDELDDLEHLGEDTDIDLEVPEADAVEQRIVADPDTSAEDDRPAH